MKRRGFLGLLAGAAVAPFVPTPNVTPHTSGSFGATPTVKPRVWVNEEMQYRDLPAFAVGDTFTVKLPQRYGPPKTREFVVTGRV